MFWESRGFSTQPAKSDSHFLQGPLSRQQVSPDVRQAKLLMAGGLMIYGLGCFSLGSWGFLSAWASQSPRCPLVPFLWFFGWQVLRRVLVQRIAFCCWEGFHLKLLSKIDPFFPDGNPLLFQGLQVFCSSVAAGGCAGPPCCQACCLAAICRVLDLYYLIDYVLLFSHSRIKCD